MFSIVILFENTFEEIIFQKQNYNENLNILENNFKFTPRVLTLQFEIISETTYKMS